MSKQTEVLERMEALRMFRLVEGPGDAGREQAFDAMTEADQDGWLKLAKESIKHRAQFDGLAFQLRGRDESIVRLTKELDLALADASKWRNHVMRFDRERFPNEVVCCQVSTQLFFMLRQNDREQLLQEQLIRAVGDLFHQISPEESLRQMLQKSGA